MLLLKNIITFKNLDTTVKCHFGRISDTEMFFIRENHIFHTGLHLPLMAGLIKGLRTLSGK